MKKFIETLKNCWKIEDLRQRLLITLLFTAIYRFGSFVVLPGINPSMLEKLQSQTSGGLMSLLDMFSLQALAEAKNLTKIGIEELKAAGLTNGKELVKVLGNGELKAKLEVEANAFSKTAEEAIKAVGGNATII